MNSREYANESKQVTTYPPSTDLWLAQVLPLNDMDDLANLAYVSRFHRNLIFLYLNQDLNQMNALLSYFCFASRAASIVSRKNEITSLVQSIYNEVNSRFDALRESEEKRCIKKSTWGKLIPFIPGLSMIGGAISKFLAATSARVTGDFALNELLKPTCTHPSEYYDVSMILARCGNVESKYTYKLCEGTSLCDVYGSESRPYPLWYYTYGCNKQICQKIVDDLVNNSAFNDLTGILLITGGIIALIVAFLCCSPIDCLNPISKEKIFSKSFVSVFNDDLQTLTRGILQLNENAFEKLSIERVIQKLNTVESVLIEDKKRLLSSPSMRTLKSTLFSKSSPKKIDGATIIEIRDEEEPEKYRAGMITL